MADFHELTVTDIRKTTREAVVVSLQAKDPDLFRFTQGQYLTFSKVFDGTELRRSYSLCNGPDENTLQIGIKQVEGGCFSSWANNELSIGSQLLAMPPMGKFHTPLQPHIRKNYILFAVGSGITPILSLIKTTLKAEPLALMTLVFANRNLNSVMFREDLEDLKNTYMGRLSVVHILKQDAQDIALFTGRLDTQKCAALFANWIDVSVMDQAFICGPEPMMNEISTALQKHGMRKDQIKYELFAGTQSGRISQSALKKIAKLSSKQALATVIIDGTSRSVEIPMNGQTVLQAALDANLDAPFSCRAGVCSTCRAKLLKGEVEMLANHALEDYEVAQGYILTCQAVPISEKLIISYDEHH
jgi:ring-1,2-phenylacetyl-CoA epoxidase subunit PaaE